MFTIITISKGRESMTKPNVCVWCHMAGSESLEMVECDRERVPVHPSHRALLESYCDETKAAKWRFLGGIGASILLGHIGVLLLLLSPAETFGAVTAGVATAICGATLIRYPFATPETLSLIGVRRSIVAGRVAGCLIVTIAVAVTVYGATL
ncbi:MAG TPA: hypothetical protein VF911_00160 [Thermoanaerobaculia bacterium]